jgi:hypothetical protein
MASRSVVNRVVQELDRRAGTRVADPLVHLGSALRTALEARTPLAIAASCKRATCAASASRSGPKQR